MFLLKDDPFLKLSLFPHSDNLYLLHGHEIVGSFIFYQIAYVYLAPWLNKVIFGHRYLSIRDRKVKINFDIHTVSNIQCAVTFYSIAPTLFLSMNLDVVTYKDNLCSMASALSVGYFLWDLFICIRYFKLYGFEFLAHALSSLYVFSLALKPFCQAWVSKFLLFEASTPFVNNNWYISQLSRGAAKPVVPVWFNMLNGLLLLVVFFSIRIAWGFTGVLLLLGKMWKVRDQLPMVQSAILLTLNIALNTLNVFWFTKMLKLAKKMLKGSAKVSKNV